MKKLFTPTISIISFFLLIYIFYKSEIVWNGEKRDYYLIYYFICFILIAFSIFTFFIDEKIRQYLIIFSITSTFCLYIFEFYLEKKKTNYLKSGLTLQEKIFKEEIYKNQTGEKYDTRSVLKIFEDLRKIEKNIKVVVNPSFYIDKKNNIFPLSNVAMSKTIFCNELGYYSIYKSDRYGFNNPDKEWDKSEIEYLISGDSLIHGSCVNRPDDIGSVLRNLSKKSIINLGQSGTGPLIQYAALKEYLNSNVNKVLWFYFEKNDLNNLSNELKNEILRNYMNDPSFTQNLKTKQDTIDEIVSESIIEQFKITKNLKKNENNFFNLDYKNIIKLSNIRTSLGNYLPPKYQPNFKPLTEFKLIIKSVKELVAKNNSKLYFIYLPQYERYKYGMNNHLKDNYLNVKKTVEDLEIPFIDIHKELFAKSENPLIFFPFELHGHYNVEGYKKIAEKVYELSKN